MGTEGEPTRLLAQWSKWNLRQKWMGEDGFDYMSGLAKIKIPALIFAGSNDDIAPVSGCKKKSQVDANMGQAIRNLNYSDQPQGRIW